MHAQVNELQRRQRKEHEKDVKKREKLQEKEKAERAAQAKLKMEEEAYQLQVGLGRLCQHERAHSRRLPNWVMLLGQACCTGGQASAGSSPPRQLLPTEYSLAAGVVSLIMTSWLSRRESADYSTDAMPHSSISRCGLQLS
jgi:hypothetical protein